MDTYRCVIIDDEAHAIAGLERYISQVPELVLIRSYTDPLKSLLELNLDERIDLILMDIDMPEINGIELSKELRHKTAKLVFTTGFSNFGYEAFELGADGYLLKPYSLAKFATTIKKIFGYKDTGHKSVIPENAFFFVKNKDDKLRMVKIRYKDVIAVESKQNYVLIYTATQNILTYMTLTEIYKILNKHQAFARFHRSYIIAIEQIVHIAGNTIKMANDLNITVGDHYRKEFTDFLAEKLIRTGQEKKE